MTVASTNQEPVEGRLPPPSHTPPQASPLTDSASGHRSRTIERDGSATIAVDPSPSREEALGEMEGLSDAAQPALRGASELAVSTADQVEEVAELAMESLVRDEFRVEHESLRIGDGPFRCPAVVKRRTPYQPSGLDAAIGDPF